MLNSLSMPLNFSLSSNGRMRSILRLANSRSKVESIPWDFPDVELRIPNIAKARKLLAFEPKVELEEGLERTLAWYAHKLGLEG